jgi:hypothetical protein
MTTIMEALPNAILSSGLPRTTTLRVGDTAVFLEAQLLGQYAKEAPQRKQLMIDTMLIVASVTSTQTHQSSLENAFESPASPAVLPAHPEPGLNHQTASTSSSSQHSTGNSHDPLGGSGSSTDTGTGIHQLHLKHLIWPTAVAAAQLLPCHPATTPLFMSAKMEMPTRG